MAMANGMRLVVFVLIVGLIAMAVHVGTAAAQEAEPAWINASKSTDDGIPAHDFGVEDTVYAFGYLGWYSEQGGNGEAEGKENGEGKGGRIYVVDHRDSWTNGTSLEEVGDGPNYVFYGEDGHFDGELAWSPTLTPGRYDLVLDLDVTGYSGVWSGNVPVVINESTINVTDPIFPFNVTAPSAGISIEKTADPTVGEPDTYVTFTITVCNTGDFALDSVKVVDTLPTGMDYDGDDYGGIESPTGTITWDIEGSLDPGASIGIMLYAMIRSDASGMQTNNVNVSGTSEAGDVTDSASADVDVLTPDIRVNKTASPTEGVPGTNVTFTITVDNIGDLRLDLVIVEDTLPEGLNYVSDDSEGIVSETRVTWWVDPMDPLDSVNITLVAQIDANASGTLTNIVDVLGVTAPPGMTTVLSSRAEVTDSDTADVAVLIPDISVNKTAAPTEGVPGTDVTFTINVTNTGDCTLNAITVLDTLPTGMRYVSSSPDADSQVGSTLTWNNLGPISASGSKTIYLIAHIDAGASGTLNNTANATGTPPAGDNVSDECYEDVTALEPAIKVTKVASPSTGAPSTDVNFTIIVTNTGDCTLDPVKLVDTLPTGMSYVSSSPTADSQDGSKVTWNNLGALSASGSKTIYLIAHIDAGASGILNNTANATGTPPAGDNVSDECYEEVTALEPEIQVTKVASPSAGAPSTNVNFSIVVTNTGDCILDPVKLVDTLPTGMRYVSSSPTADSQDGSTLTWNNLGPLSASDSKTIYLIAHIDAGASGTLNNTANATGTPPAGDNVSDEVYEEVTALEPEIKVTKAASPSAGAPSTNVNFTIVVTNTGDCTLDPVKLVDTLPTGMRYVSSSPTADSQDGSTVTWNNLGPLSASDSKTIYLIAHIDAGASGTLNNTAKATGESLLRVIMSLTRCMKK